MSTIFAGVPTDFTNVLVQYGPMGIICVWLMWREMKQQERAANAEERREARHDETQKEIRMQRNSLDDMVRVLALEVLTRPELQQRAEHDARQILDSVKARTGGA